MFAALLASAAIFSSPIPPVLPLWSHAAPGALGDGPDDVPTLTTHLAKNPTGAAFIVCPGGGYGFLAPYEGGPVADFLASHGITSFVLKYRIAPKYHYPCQYDDVMRAMRQVRYHAAEWGIDPNKIGIMGFSAGGHLAGTAATCFDDGIATAPDPIDRVSSKPDAAALIYPVITMHKSFTHMGSRENLIGKHPSESLVKEMSVEERVTDQTPPSFIVATDDDTVVPIQNSLSYISACWAHHVPIEVHIFAHGPHGFGLGTGNPMLSQWPHACAEWLKWLHFAN